MQWFSMMFSGSGKTIKRHPVISLMMVVQIWICLTMTGNMLVGVQKAEQNVAVFNQQYIGKTYYSTSECLSDNAYYTYLSDGGQGYRKLHTFATRLLASESLTYIMMMEQSIDLTEDLPGQFCCGYENGDADESSYFYQGETYHAMKALQVSKHFLEEFNVSVDDGVTFQDRDFRYSNGEIVPILLGNEYHPWTSLGDLLHGIYLGEDMVFKVVGFLSDDSYFYSRQQKNMVSCNRYILMPAMLSSATDGTDFNRIRLLQQMEGVIVSDLDYQTVQAQYEDLKVEANIEDWEVEVRDPNAKIDQNSVLKTYSAMTDEVSKQFHILLAIVIGFVIISMSLTISGLIREKKYEYGVRILCGAPPVSIWGNAIAQTGIFILLGDMLAVVTLFGTPIRVMLLLRLLSIAIWALACGMPTLSILRIKLNEMIGGKE